MEQFAMDARRREQHGTGPARAFRREGFVPGIVYGQGQEPISIVLEARRLQAFLRHQGSLINLTVDGQVAQENLAALVKELQRHPVSREVLSVDLQWVSMIEAVEVRVPVTVIGSAPGVARDGGALDLAMHELTVACLPGDIPQYIEVDVSGLEIGHSIHVSAITPPPGVTIITGAEEAVITIIRPVTKEDLETKLEEGEVAEGAEGAEAPAKPGAEDAAE